MDKCQQVAVPDPQWIKEVYLRQILVPLRKNQQALAKCISECGDNAKPELTASEVAKSKFPARVLGKPILTGVKLGGSATESGVADATDLPSVIALANSLKGVVALQAGLINQLIAAQNVAIDDRDALADQFILVQAQLMLLINKVNS